MFKNNGPESSMDTQDAIRARMTAYDALPAVVRARLQATGEDVPQFEPGFSDIQDLLMIDRAEIQEAA